MINYIQGDLFDTPNGIIAHGCNCKGVMGSGVARIVRDKYPKAYNAYIERYEYDDLWLGEIQAVLQDDGKYIVNCMTQNGFMPRDICHADYEAIEKCMWRLKKFAMEKSLSVAIPKIGAGLAGGDWAIIEKILEEVFSDYDITVYYL